MEDFMTFWLMSEQNYYVTSTLPFIDNKVSHRRAATQAEYCNVTQIIDDRGYKGFKRNETYQKEWYDVCVKSEHPTSVICPNNNYLLKPLSEYAVKNTNNIR